MLISIKNINQRLEVDLPLSKSESNRALMIWHYSGSIDYADLTHLSDSDDTVLLRELLSKVREALSGAEVVELDCNNAGTVLRFLLTAVANMQSAIDDGSTSNHQGFLLTGSERMQRRPIGVLVDTLRRLGVSVEYKGRDGYPPLLVRGCRIEGGRVEVSAEQSSQFVSSLLLAAPLWRNGLELHLTGDVSSLSYIDMTISMMRRCGIDVERNGRVIIAKPGTYNLGNINIEPDWSAAAFWYEMVAFSDDSEIMLKNLNINSLQADAASIKMFERLCVETTASDKGVILKKSKSESEPLSFDFRDCPDLFPAVIATCAGLKVDATFTGLRNLSIKESDRKQAMMNELKKIGVSFENISDDEMKMFCHQELPCFTEENPMVFDNYEDHRIAMALSILSMKIGAVSMEKPEVVSKSYPKFWEESFITLT